jgi:hypothetical protein
MDVGGEIKVEIALRIGFEIGGELRGDIGGEESSQRDRNPSQKWRSARKTVGRHREEGG